ncbi:MAG: helix-turn-helix domain-containing protein, partial [Candidatus Pacebacteria bacterium]|nr:helix-turn-helix domain-containing protein [Candidatus Paceibacterota bacterium]
KQLAEKVGVKSQQIQRWENEDYATAGFKNLVKIADAIGVEVSEEISFRRVAKDNLDTLRSLGIEKEFIKRRLVPEAGREEHELVSTASTFLKKIWGLVVHADGRLDTSGYNCSAASAARFKLPKNADPARARAYAQYVLYVASCITSGMKAPPVSVPRDWTQIRELLGQGGGLSLKASLEKVWDMGIPVIPLSDPLRFHGSCMRIGDRNAIVLKQTVRSESHWLFDLLHELYHAGEAPDATSFAETPLDGTDPDRRESEDEKAANAFAGNALMNGKADELYSLILERSRRRLPAIKNAVVSVASENGADIGILANYVAYKLKTESYINWWGAAANLQPESEDAYSIAAAVFKDRFDLESLSEDDRRIVELAIVEPSI